MDNTVLLLIAITFTAVGLTGSLALLALVISIIRDQLRKDR